jgi:hypothetical protein
VLPQEGDAVRQVCPEYDPRIHKMKIGVKQSNPSSQLPPVFHLTVVNPDGSEIIKRLPAREMRTIIAASNFKQRSRMSFLYYHAERLHYVVVGTPNKHEVEQGFFVKYGDGGGDIFPIEPLKASIPAGRIPGCAKSSAHTYRYLQRRTDAGGVLLPVPARAARPAMVRVREWLPP